MNVLEYVLVSTAPKGKKVKNRPFVKKVDQEIIHEDLTRVCRKVENGAPILYMFFKEHDYDCSLICADEQIISCGTSLQNALLCYIGAYSVFHVGYAQEHANFLSFFEMAILKKDTSSVASHPIGWSELLKKLDDLFEIVEEQ